MELSRSQAHKRSFTIAELQALDPCANGCVLGLGASCANRRRNPPLYMVCIECANGHEEHIQQTRERSGAPYTPSPPQADSAEKARAGAAAIAMAKGCLYRGEKLGGCGCFHVCHAGPAGMGRQEGGEWRASLGECVACVKRLVDQGDVDAGGTK